MDAIAIITIIKLVKKGAMVKQAESDRLIQIEYWAMKEYSMLIRNDLDAAVIEIRSNMMLDIEKGKQCTISFASKRSKVSKTEAKGCTKSRC